MRRIIATLVLVGMGLVGTPLFAGAANTPPQATCGDAGLLSGHLDRQTGHVNLTPGVCFTGELSLHNTHNLTLNANGDHFYQATASTDTGLHPLVYLTQNKNLEIDNISVTGLYDGTNGGPGREGSYGVLAEANHGLTIRNSSFSNVQGDFVNLQSPNGLPTQDLNTSVMVTGDTFTNAGYHGITIEAVDGATFSHNTFSGMGPDAIDLEADIYSTNIAPGEGRYRAENNIDIRQNHFSDYGVVLLANIQPQSPGVQESHVSVSDNTLNAPSAIVEIVGSPLTNPRPYWTQYITISHNTGSSWPNATKGASGGAVGSAGFEVASAALVSITDNTLPFADGTCDPPATFNYQCNIPTTPAANLYGVLYGTVRDNTFDGALGVLTPNSGANAFVRTCGNRFGVSASAVDVGC